MCHKFVWFLTIVGGDNPQNQPYEMKNPFGWCVAGPTSGKEYDNKPAALAVFEFDWAEDKRDM